MDVRVGSLFSGYGGLDMAVGGNVVWYSEIEPAACKVLAAHHPNVRNLGDVTKIDWASVPPIDVLTGGYPCQPFSTAGLRKGKNDERHLWPYVRDAISTLRPQLVVLENVRGHLSMGLADVIGDLAAVGYDARWGLVRASDAGAPHSRARVFIVANPNGAGLQGTNSWLDLGEGRSYSGGHASSSNHGSVADPSRGSFAWTPTTWDGLPVFAQRGIQPVADAESDDRNERSPRHDSWHVREAGQSEGAAGGVHSDVAYSNGASGEAFNDGRSRAGDSRRRKSLEHRSTDWGQYRDAVSRWEPIIGRPAPAPTYRRDDRDRLNPLFVEWMMGLPEGHVTGHGLSATQELKMLGNGVCPQQAALALRLLGAA